jgi:hypothetical protein
MRARFALPLLVVVILSATAAWVVRHPAMPPADKTCFRRGALGTPVSMVAEGVTLGIYGWAYDNAGVREIQVVADGAVVGKAALTVARPDVVATLAHCRPREPSGFAFTVSIGPAPVPARRYEVRAVTALGEAYPIGATTLRFEHPVGYVDTSEPIRWNGPNVVAGWAIARGGQVRVLMMAGDRELARADANRPRDDVFRIFNTWPQAARSGFEFSLSMRNLPRGRYFLKVRFEGPDGTHTDVAGPEVRNDEPLGKVKAVADRFVNPDAIALDAWVFAEDGVDSVTLETEEGIALGPMLAVRRSVPLTNFEHAASAGHGKTSPIGTVYRARMATTALPPGIHRLAVLVTTREKRTAILPGPLVRMGPPLAEACDDRKWRLYYPGNHKAFKQGFPRMRSWRDLVGAGCAEVGFRGRVEYLRTTRGRKHDYVFDPDFPNAGRLKNGREMTGESLRSLLDLALRLKAPLLITLDGGVWADAAFSDPEIDVVDMLEEDERTVQWNQFGRSEADNALGDLAGSMDSPELSRMMSLNRFNTRFLDYKKRNLQAAVREIIRFSRAHPKIEVKINLDPDLYINPWFYLTQWYDYNTDTLRQFREWLFHLGPYGDGGGLALARQEPKITLQEASRLAGKQFASIDEVEPPRGAIDYADPWQQMWSHFRRHLVAQHYEDMATWAAEAGMPPSSIYTAQTFILADVAVGVRGRATNWTDQAGVSIEGAKPTQGQLGTILYGPASRNMGEPRSGRSLIGNIRSVDPDWGAVEFHPAVIAQPEKLPTQTESYQTMLAIVNGGANFMSPMWGSRADDQKLHPEKFRAYDSMEGTAFEFQLAWWMLQLQRLPVGNLLFPFGNALVDSDDGWTGGKGTQIRASRGQLQLDGDSISVASPVWDGLRTKQRLTLEAIGSWPQRQVKAEILLKNGDRLTCSSTAAPLRCTLPTRPGDQLEQARLEWEGKGGGMPGVALDEVRLELK